MSSEGASWRTKSYGRIAGGEIERCVSMFKEAWAGRLMWSLDGGEEKWLESVQRLMPVLNWTPYYQLSFTEVIARIVVVAGLANAVTTAVETENPVSSLLDAVGDIPEVAPDHPEAIPLAFAMVGNLDAIARYSRSINDLILACKSGDFEALFQALSVDSYLSTMPFFQAAMRLGQLANDESMAESVFRAIKGSHKKRFEYAELRWVEYLLREQGAFEACSREEIYELIIVHLGLYDPTGVKKDPKSALFTLFRAWQKGAGIQNPRFGFSGKAK
jgi:hypothetical protein